MTLVKASSDALSEEKALADTQEARAEEKDIEDMKWEIRFERSRRALRDRPLEPGEYLYRECRDFLASPSPSREDFERIMQELRQGGFADQYVVNFSIGHKIRHKKFGMVATYLGRNADRTGGMAKEPRLKRGLHIARNEAHKIIPISITEWEPVDNSEIDF